MQNLMKKEIKIIAVKMLVISLQTEFVVLIVNTLFFSCVRFIFELCLWYISL